MYQPTNPQLSLRQKSLKQDDAQIRVIDTILGRTK